MTSPWEDRERDGELVPLWLKEPTSVLTGGERGVELLSLGGAGRAAGAGAGTLAVELLIVPLSFFLVSR